MKHQAISLFVVSLGMLAVLHGYGGLGNHGSANNQGGPVAVVATSGTGIVEAIHVQGERGGDSAVLGKLLIDKQQDRPAGMTVYSIRVRMGDGVTQTVLQDSAAGLRVGERVRLDSGRVYSS